MSTAEKGIVPEGKGGALRPISGHAYLNMDSRGEKNIRSRARCFFAVGRKGKKKGEKRAKYCRSTVRPERRKKKVEVPFADWKRAAGVPWNGEEGSKHKCKGKKGKTVHSK